MLSICSLVNGHLGWLNLLAILNAAVMKTCAKLIEDTAILPGILCVL